jgi:hypothetical protein
VRRGRRGLALAALVCAVGPLWLLDTDRERSGSARPRAAQVIRSDGDAQVLRSVAAPPTTRRTRAVEVNDRRRSPGTSALLVEVQPPGLAGVELVLRQGGREVERRAVSDGRARFEELIPGPFLLRAHPPAGWAERIPAAAAWPGPGGWRSIVVAGEEPVLRVRVRLEPAASLGGAVEGAEGPLADARVLLHAPGSLEEPRSARTDAQGCFRFDGLVAARYVVCLDPLEDRAAGGAFVPVELEASPGASDWIVLRREDAPGVVHGTVLDDQLRPVAGLRLVCATAQPDRPRGGRVLARTRTDERGSFTFERLPLARLRVAVDGRELRHRSTEAQRPVQRVFEPVVLQTAEEPLVLDPLRVERPPASASPPR